MHLVDPIFRHALGPRNDARSSSSADLEKTLAPTVETELQQSTPDGPHAHRNTLNTYVLPSSAHDTSTTHFSNHLTINFPDRPTNREVPNPAIPDPPSKEVRLLPLISSVFVPFSILLAVPGLTEHWYIQTNDQHETVEFQENPAFLVAMLIISMVCAVVANVCLAVRLFEKMVKKATICCIVVLTIHDALDITAIIIFIIKTQADDGFILGQAFWMTTCSSIASLVTNVTLVLDFLLTPASDRDKSGLTQKQRSLTILIIGLLCYVAFGAAVHTSLLSLSFIDALYFTVVCIETVGFGDINPQTVGARFFSSIYTAIGILILAVTIGFIREAILEAIQNSMRTQIRRARKRRIMNRWHEAVKWRLRNARLPLWAPVDEDEESQWPNQMGLGNGRWKRIWYRWSDVVKGYARIGRSDDITVGFRSSVSGRWMRLNLRALSETQLQAAAMEAGAPLQEFLPQHPDHQDHQDHHDYDWGWGPEPTSPTQHRLGRMIAVLGNFAYAMSVGQDASRMVSSGENQPDTVDQPRTHGNEDSSTGSLTPVELEQMERRLFAIRVAIALSLFFTFWLVGSAIFTATEKWSYSLSLYFCFITFSTVGYGDPVPRTPAGRSFFVGWALCGVGTMSILISLLADGYSERYKNIFVEESAITASDTRAGGTQGTDPTPLPSSTHMNSDGHRNATHMDTQSIGEEQSSVLPHEEMLSRFDTLKTLVVDEAAHKEGRLFHNLECELQAMLSLIRRSRKWQNLDDS
ncbi:voltage-gated potassium channel [Macrolepiota fuliginosa MF-IS2]|uniref:Voltage-gated potassium channel n=1 Tax=Macrolepiota fuliginosa MF-IS2 TaxID=1400762 RepID=A0A9P6C287_9AGAR|nr:voltage-gated potassium channel [Macrolepiota fuliginosa MF-IS2]